jgi:hypothetical protein
LASATDLCSFVATESVNGEQNQASLIRGKERTMHVPQHRVILIKG